MTCLAFLRRAGLAAWFMLAGLAAAAHAAAPGAGPDPRLREIAYDPHKVVTVPVKRGMVSLLVLDDDETITHVAAGLGGDCAKTESAWCIAAQPGGRHVFVKAKSQAQAPNNLAVVTDRRTHAFRFEVLDDADARLPVHRLEIRAQARPSEPGAVATVRPGLRGGAPHDAQAIERMAQQSLQALQAAQALMAMQALPRLPAPHEVVAERLQERPRVVNTRYALAEGEQSQDIVPTLVFDDGRFTYLRFPGNRDVPAVFHVQGDGSESLVNTRMEDDLLVVDRVSRRLVLRAGEAVVGLWNEAFDIDGRAPVDATTVSGVQRVLKAPAGQEASP